MVLFYWIGTAGVQVCSADGCLQGKHGLGFSVATNSGCAIKFRNHSVPFIEWI